MWLSQGYGVPYCRGFLQYTMECSERWWLSVDFRCPHHYLSNSIAYTSHGGGVLLKCTFWFDRSVGETWYSESIEFLYDRLRSTPFVHLNAIMVNIEFLYIHFVVVQRLFFLFSKKTTICLSLQLYVSYIFLFIILLPIYTFLSRLSSCMLSDNSFFSFYSAS